MTRGHGPHQEQRKQLTKKGEAGGRTRKGLSKCQEHQLAPFRLFSRLLTPWLGTKELVVRVLTTEKKSMEKKPSFPWIDFFF